MFWMRKLYDQEYGKSELVINPQFVDLRLLKRGIFSSDSKGSATSEATAPQNSTSTASTTPEVTDKMILEEATGERVELPCRSIRVGSYKSMPKERAVFTEKGIHLKVPDICSGKHVVM